MKISILVISCAVLFLSCTKNDDNAPSRLDGENAGGETTVYVRTSQAFGLPAPNLSAQHLNQHLLGDTGFEAQFVASPAPRNGGLGPVFNNISCNGCHPSDGRASFPENINSLSGFFYKISVPGTDEHGGPAPVPGFGTQLQHQSIYGFQAEGKMSVTFQEQTVSLADGTIVTLRKPTYSIVSPYLPLPGNMMISPRIGMPVFGLGLLEAIPEAAILANADPDDRDKDEISGKANYVWDPVSETTKMGRFGWKAGTPSVLVQTAGAYNEDMGLTNYLKPVESSVGQTNGDPTSISPEVSREILENVVFYSLTLGVPAGRNFDDPEVIAGNKIFNQLKCATCHVPSFITTSYEGIPEISNQKIYPYTDMLLHDMGEELADNRPEFLANGKEWKTRPLWGIGLTAVTSGHTSFLHDGRARNITEAILWHSGEAEKSKDDFKNLSSKDREKLLRFLESL
jgi:Predicted thiol oxidoreductase